ncbi:MAG: P-II family nitrogen regulator [Acidimicrobiia bacterium]|nr:P-II family nitrogen regulator [Acidimicrobiia bacterium]MDH5519119.1 P-II family nitrogen regulator [Acidimicrobiia bacterium]
MKLVTAIIKPHRLTEVKDALVELGVNAMTVTEVKGFGRQGGHTETYRGAEYRIDFVPKIRIDIVAGEEMVDLIVNAVQQGAQTGVIGDGKVWVTPVDSMVRIRTGDSGVDAV